MKTKILIILLIFLANFNFAQDVIVKKSGDEINAKVTEVATTEIKYKKTDNPDVVYTIPKTDVFMIKYANGTKDVFADNKTTTNTTTLIVKDTATIQKNNSARNFSEITKKGNKVYIESDDDAVVIHATNYLNDWGYWDITKEKSEADFIIEFYMKYSFWNGWEGYVEFINPVTEYAMKQTKTEYEASIGMDMNGKRNCVKRVIKKCIKPLFD